MGYKVPTPVQRKALPVCLLGGDVVCMARTGSGKTAAFVVPMLEKLGANSPTYGGVRGLILSPTRDLALQTLRVIKSMSKFTDLRAVSIVGGDGMEKQFEDLSNKPDIIVATPGRLAHHLLEVPDFNLRHMECVVYDEADRLFEMGFAQQLRDISRSMPEGRQTLLFSATMPKMLVEFARAGLQDPTLVRLDNEATVSENLRLSFLTCRSTDKDGALLYILREVLPPKGLTIIFAATRHHVEYLTTLIKCTGMSAVCIYGTMDVEARKSNLHVFRTGKVPVLVVTDVAARGLDVPMIDNVIHHSFPPSPKLFIHRSGRAARAGRVGYAFALVEPDETPFMVDLHLFLGRRVCNPMIEMRKKGDEKEEKEGGGLDAIEGIVEGEEEEEEEEEEAKAIDDEYKGNNSDLDDDSSDSDDSDSDSNSKPTLTSPSADSDPSGPPKSAVLYSLTQQTPEDVHFGSIPESVMTDENENVRRIIANESGNKEADNFDSLIRTAKNGMKQYKRSRPDPSREGVRRSKDLLHMPIPPHPLLAYVEHCKLEKMRTSMSEIRGMSGAATNTKTTVGSADDYIKRSEFLTAMSTFRPKETIFEAGARAAGSNVAGQIDKGRNTGSIKGDTQAIMKSMRREMKVVRNKGSIVAAGSQTAKILNGDDGGEDQEDGLPPPATSLIVARKTTPAPINAPEPTKRRMSKAERRRAKSGKPPPAPAPAPPATQSSESRSFKSDDYIEYDRGFTQRDREVEAALQPSAGDGKNAQSAAMEMEQHMLDIVGDENIDLVKKQRIMRWDKSKRKYIQTTVGDEASGMTQAKKVRLESGIQKAGKDMKLGQLYEKWQKKTNKSVGRAGVMDDVDVDMEEARRENDPGQKEAKKANPRWMTKEKMEQKKANKLKNDQDMKSRSEIKKKKEQDMKNKIKNMKKSDRASYVKHIKSKEKGDGEGKATTGKGGKGKGKFRK